MAAMVFLVCQQFQISPNVDPKLGVGLYPAKPILRQENPKLPPRGPQGPEKKELD